jgi:DNA (cytosine-5)-methyltransferase 1
MWWTKSRRAQNVDDYETWISGGVVPTLNVFDNASETRATILIIDGTRVNDVRVYEDGIVPTVISRYGTGGGNVPMVFEPKSAFEENWAESEVKNALRANASKSSHAVLENKTVRRLTPIECERLQGFPDDWTSGQADSNRYKQMGNAVAVPVVEWIVTRMVAQLNGEPIE